MLLLLELEGVVIDILPVWCQQHRLAAHDVGWSSLDAPTFRRLTRKEGRDANLLRGARPTKIKEYHARFDERVESDAAIAEYETAPETGSALAGLTRFGTISLITLGTNTAARAAAVAQLDLPLQQPTVVALNADPRRRPGELRVLAGDERRVIVAASTDAVIRAAVDAELFAVGVSSGTCSEARLHQAGAAIVYRHLEDLSESLSRGGQDMIRVGLLPFPIP